MTETASQSSGAGLRRRDVNPRKYRGNPRVASTYATTLTPARKANVPLMFALAQLTHTSAKRLGDMGLKAMQDRGRGQVGKVADLRIFEAQKLEPGSPTGWQKTGTPGLHRADSRHHHAAQRAFLSELIEKLNDLFGEGITEDDKVMFAVHISEKLRGNEIVMAQVEKNTKEQALKADLPDAATDAFLELTGSHEKMVTRILSDEGARKIFLGLLYEI